MLVPTQTPMNCFCQKPNNLKVVFTVATAIIGGQKHRKTSNTMTLLKSILFKNILAKSNSLVNLHVSAPHFGACLPEISGQNRANLLGYWIW